MINHITIQGRMIRDAETRHTQSGLSVTSFTLANDNGFGANKKTLFIDCTAWKGAGETIAKYCPKGSQIIVSGTLNCREWTDKNGNKRKSYEINVSDFGFCDSKKETTAGQLSQQSPKQDFIGTEFQDLEDDEDENSLPF